MLIGYARVSTVDQNLALQRDALTEAGCEKIFTEQMLGAVTDRPALHDALEFARSGDTLIVWKLDRLAHSMKQLIETIENLRMRGIGSHVWRVGGIRAQPDAGAHPSGPRRRSARRPPDYSGRRARAGAHQPIG